jgi:hypothetical protein
VRSICGTHEFSKQSLNQYVDVSHALLLILWLAMVSIKISSLGSVNPTLSPQKAVNESVLSKQVQLLPYQRTFSALPYLCAAKESHVICRFHFENAAQHRID